MTSPLSTGEVRTRVTVMPFQDAKIPETVSVLSRIPVNLLNVDHVKSV